MRDLFQAGLVAARVQAIAAAGMPALVTFLLRYPRNFGRRLG